MIVAAAPSSPEANRKPSVEWGEKLYTQYGCMACHSIDGTVIGKLGGTWKGIYGTDRKLIDGKTAKATDAYLKESILEPTAKVVAGHDAAELGMPPFKGILNDAQVASLVLFIKTLK